jgi:hypothetical protein
VDLVVSFLSLGIKQEKQSQTRMAAYLSQEIFSKSLKLRILENEEELLMMKLFIPDESADVSSSEKLLNYSIALKTLLGESYETNLLIEVATELLSSPARLVSQLGSLFPNSDDNSFLAGDSYN